MTATISTGDASAGPSSPTAASSSESVMTRSSPVVLNVAYPAVQDIRGPEGLSGLWHVFSKCKGSLQDGARLENISWRHWYQTCANAHALRSDTSPFSSLHPVTLSSSYPSDAEAPSSISTTMTNELESEPSSSRRGSTATTATRRSGSPHSPHSPLDGSGRRDSWNSSMADGRSRSKERERLSPVNAMGPRRDADADGDVEFSTAVDDLLAFPGSNGQPRQTSSSLAKGSSGTTPRPASYPTPPTCRPGYHAMRSHSHAADQRSVSNGSCRARHVSDTAPRETVSCRCGKGARWRKADRSFGQVLTDVFRVPSITDVAMEGRLNRLRDRERLELMKRDMAALKWSQKTEDVEGDRVDNVSEVKEESQEEPTTSNASSSQAAPPPRIVTQPPPTISAPTSQPHSRRTSTDHGGSKGSSPRGPQVNVLEPTPVPSRVGSLGDAQTPTLARSPLHAHAESSGSDLGERKDTTSASSTISASPSSSATAVRQPPAASRISMGLVPLTAMRLEHPTATSPPVASTSKHSDRPPMTPQQRSAARKNNKKSIFFIQSPGHAAKQMRRQGSLSGSEGSVSTGSVSLSPMILPKQGVSPLSAESLPSAVVNSDATTPVDDTAVVISPEDSALASSNNSQMALAPTAAFPAVPATAPATTTAAAKRRASSASQKPPPHIGHRKVSNERPHHHAHLNKHHHGAHFVPPKRTASAAQMAGKFQGEKARAAEVINARLQAQQAAEKEKQAEARSKLLLAKRQQSEPDFAMAQTRKTQGEPIVVADGEEDEWSSETEETLGSGEGKGASSNLPGGRPPKQGKGKEMDLAKAADEARRQRELFAKRAIYGSNGEPQKPQGGPGPSTVASRPGLLSNLFETQRDVIRRNASMVDLMPKRQLSSMAMSSHAPHNGQSTHPTPSPHVFNLNRSKSVVAMPVATGVSVSKDGFVGPNGLDGLPDKMESRHTSSRGKLRLPPKPRPDENELSPSSSPQDTSSILATSEALRRIECLAGRRRETSKVNLSSQLSPASNDSSSPIPPPMASQLSAPLQRVHSNPMPMQYGQALLVEPAMPQTPTTRRRQMLATELPEDLRLNLIWERRSRTPLYPPKRTTALKACASAHDLPQSERDVQTQERQDLRMQRQDSQPVVSNTNGSPKDRQDGNNGGQSRRRHVNLLSGGAILRPLTKSHLEPSPPQESRRESNNPRAGLLAQRAKSTANVVDLGRGEDDNWQKYDRVASEAPGIQRRRTEGEARAPWEKARDLKTRQGELSSSFRSHGW